MAKVRQKNSSPEISLRKELHRRGLRYRLHVRGLPGSPDIVFPKHKVAVFVNGCFWHRHKGCARASFPKTNQHFWEEKFAANVARDERNYRDLRSMGWLPVVIWECQILGSPADAATLVQKALSPHS